MSNLNNNKIYWFYKNNNNQKIFNLNEICIYINKIFHKQIASEIFRIIKVIKTKIKWEK
jgi:hypothetical protein